MREIEGIRNRGSEEMGSRGSEVCRSKESEKQRGVVRYDQGTVGEEVRKGEENVGSAG